MDEATKTSRFLSSNISIADIEIKDLLYQPKTEHTTRVYGQIIKFVRKQLGFQHNSIINGAADEVILSMKNGQLDEETRRAEIDKLLSTDEPLDDDEYSKLFRLCKEIDDMDAVEDGNEDETGAIGAIMSDDGESDEYAPEEVHDSDIEFDLDQMLEDRANNKEVERLNLEELAKKQANIVPRVDIGEPVRKEGYHEYNIVPKKRRTHSSDEFVKIESLPEYERLAFGDLKHLNYIQSKIYKSAIGSDQSLLICAPTGAGKTNIALLAMLREILKYRDGHGFDTSKFKIIYVAPIKALVQEIVENFTKRLGRDPFNLVVEELTGDHQLDQKQISRAQVIVCTPEKWDIVTRKSLDRIYTKLVRLVIFDEIHLLHNERGATLEALIARIKRHKFMEGEPIRIIGLSATLPNYQDVSRFISPNPREESTFYFDSSDRPIPLRQQYIALTESKKVFRIINDIVYEKIIERLADHSQILVFVHSRPDTTKTAEFIKNKAIEDQKVGLFLTSETSAEKIEEYGKNIPHKLRELLQFGLGTHHAGMSKYERSCVEELFRGRYIRVLVSTATLAWGVNLPARTVIIKGTQVYRDGHWTDLDSLDVCQMLGRAGRPGYDREGEGIVITQQSKVAFYISLMTEQLPVESKLIGRLPEFINAECVIGNIENLDGAVKWLSETYLSSRMMSVLEQGNEQYMSMYGIKPQARDNDPDLSAHKSSLAYHAACILDDRGLIVFDRKNKSIESTELGEIASKYNCSSRTIKMFYDSIHEYSSDIELFRTFSLADEFKEIFVRRGEETDLAVIINQVPYPIDDKRATPGANKTNVLLQVYIFRMNIEGSDLICDMHFIKENAARLARAIHEIVLMKGYASVAELSLDMCRKIDLRMTSCHTPLRQFADDLDLKLLGRLEKKDYHIDELRLLKADKLTELLRCDTREGEKICKMLRYLPKLKIEAGIKPMSKTSLKLDLSITASFSWNEKYHGSSERFWLLVEDVNQEKLLHHEIIYVRKQLAQDKIRISFHVPYITPVQPFYYVRIFPDRWFGCDHHLPIYIEKLTLPEETVISTQILDQAPQSFHALKDTEYEHTFTKFYGKNFRFNPIQTQCFETLFRTNDDVILLAPAGSGKTICGELVVTRNIITYKQEAKCAYVCANLQAAEAFYDRWRNFYKQCCVLQLTGNHRADAKLIESEKERPIIVIGSPETWHVLTLTRSKRSRKLLHKFQLFVIDDIHTIHSDQHSTLEWLCSKIRIFTKLDAELRSRIVALGSPMTCAESLKSWLSYERGTKEPILFNFPPSLRPVTLDLTIQKYHHYDYKMRQLTMCRPVYRQILPIFDKKPTIVFVSDFNEAINLSETFISYISSEDRSFISPRASLSDVTETRLRRSLRKGVGFIYLGMNRRDRVIVEDLFNNEKILILVATVGCCWSISCRSYLTIIMDTQYYNGSEAVDYDLMDVMQMVGVTGRQLARDHDCRCIVMCQHSKAAYFERFLREPIPAESYLPSNLISFVNFEILVGALVELNDIYKPYLAHTFFYKRISINPNYYGLMVGDDQEQKARVFGNFFNNLINKITLELEKTEFITMEGGHENPTFTPGHFSEISAEHYINYQTLIKYNKWLSSNAYQLRPLELIELLSTSTIEFDRIPVRQGELAFLKYLQRRHRPREGDQLGRLYFKIKLLILSQYSKVKSDREEDKSESESVEGELVEDRNYILGLSYRLLMAIVDIAWIKDSFQLAKTAIQLSKKLCPFQRDTRPNIDMKVTALTRDKDLVKVDVTCERQDEPFSYDEFRANMSFLSPSLFRREGWSFLIYGQSRREKDDAIKFLMFQRVKTPEKGSNHYELTFSITDESDTCTYDLYFMSDFYSKEDTHCSWLGDQIVLKE